MQTAGAKATCSSFQWPLFADYDANDMKQLVVKGRGHCSCARQLVAWKRVNECPLLSRKPYGLSEVLSDGPLSLLSLTALQASASETSDIFSMRMS